MRRQETVFDLHNFGLISPNNLGSPRRNSCARYINLLGSMRMPNGKVGPRWCPISLGTSSPLCPLPSGSVVSSVWLSLKCVFPFCHITRIYIKCFVKRMKLNTPRFGHVFSLLLEKELYLSLSLHISMFCCRRIS